MSDLGWFGMVNWCFGVVWGVLGWFGVFWGGLGCFHGPVRQHPGHPHGCKSITSSMYNTFGNIYLK